MVVGSLKGVNYRLDLTGPDSENLFSRELWGRNLAIPVGACFGAKAAVSSPGDAFVARVRGQNRKFHLTEF